MQNHCVTHNYVNGIIKLLFMQFHILEQMEHILEKMEKSENTQICSIWWI